MSPHLANTVLFSVPLFAFIQFSDVIFVICKVEVESRFKEDLSMDSLDHVEMIMLIEDEFGKGDNSITVLFVLLGTTLFLLIDIEACADDYRI